MVVTKIVVAAGYGGPEVLAVQQVDVPAPGTDQVLIDVRAAGANPIVDYRTTFFTLNGTDTTNNSIVSVTYQTANGPMTASNVVPNYAIDGHSPTSMTFPCHFGQDTVTPFGMNGSGGDVPVPEPASAALAALGLIGLLAWRIRRGRR